MRGQHESSPGIIKPSAETRINGNGFARIRALRRKSKKKGKRDKGKELREEIDCRSPGAIDLRLLSSPLLSLSLSLSLFFFLFNRASVSYAN